VFFNNVPMLADARRFLRRAAERWARSGGH